MRQYVDLRHGDTPAAVSIARTVRDTLVVGGIELKSFTDG